MPARSSLYHAVLDRIATVGPATGLPRAAQQRLALLVTGVIAAQSSVLARIAVELFALGVTGATCWQSVERRLRRTLNDPHLAQATCYAALLREVIAWPPSGGRVVLALDDSSQDARVHLLRVSLVYWGGSVPVAWAAWPANRAQPPGHYWTQVEAVLARTATVLPVGVAVVLTADRAFDIPAFVDRVAAHGWHRVVRAKANSALRFRDWRGREGSLAQQVRARVARRGQRWKARGAVFKKAGWRAASVLAVWAPGTRERLVVLTDLRPAWALLATSGERFWIETGFRTDKTAGWHWEDSQVQGVAHHERLLLAMAWASLLMVCLGCAEAQAQRAALARRRVRLVAGQPRPARPQPARESLFTLGLRQVRRWLYATASGALPWRLPDLGAPSWTAQWYHCQAYRFIFPSTVRP